MTAKVCAWGITAAGQAGAHDWLVTTATDLIEQHGPCCLASWLPMSVQLSPRNGPKSGSRVRMYDVPALYMVLGASRVACTSRAAAEADAPTLTASSCTACASCAQNAMASCRHAAPAQREGQRVGKLGKHGGIQESRAVKSAHHGMQATHSSSSDTLCRACAAKGGTIASEPRAFGGVKVAVELGGSD